MRTRVLILDQQSYWGGAQRVLQMILESLRDQIRPRVVLPGSGPFASDLRMLGIETGTYPLGVYRSGRKSALDMVEFGSRTVWCAGVLARTILKHRIDLVFINGPRCLPSGVMAAQLTGRPSLFSLHNTLTRRAEVALVGRGAAYASRIVTCSQAAAGVLLNRDPNLASKLQVLYPPLEDSGIPTSPTRSRRDSSGFVIGMVGRVTPAKGHHILLQAIARLKARESIRLLFVGSPAPGSLQDLEYAAFLRQKAKEDGADIEWAGQQPDPDPYYRRMDVLVVPSVGGSIAPGRDGETCSSSEGMPLVILEAFQRRLPVVASRTGGTPEVMKHGVNGILVRPGDPEELAGALDRLHAGESLRRELAERAYSSLDQRFSREAYCLTIGRLIAELCGSPAAAASRPMLDWTGMRS